MNVIISNADGWPIYEQIYQQIKGAIMKGELKEGDALPSIRALAKDLRISVITTKRAFDDLEKDGFIRSVQGKGSFVAPADPELLKEEQLKRLESRGYISRKPSPVDGRSCTLSLTPCGVQLVIAAQKECSRTIALLQKELGPERFRLLLELIEESNAALRKNLRLR